MFVDLFKIPLNDGENWDNTVGVPDIKHLGLCGKTIKSTGDAFERRTASLKNLGFLSDEDSTYSVSYTHLTLPTIYSV